MTYPAIAHGYRERLLKVLPSHEVFTIMREIGQPTDTNAVRCREYLLAHWSNDIRDRVMTIIKDNIEVT